MCSLSPLHSSSSPSSSFSLCSLRERYERLHAIILKEFEARGWETYAGAELTLLSDLLSQALQDEQQLQSQEAQAALSSSSEPQPQPTGLAATCEEVSLPAAAEDGDEQEAAGDGFQAPETFEDDDSSDGSDTECEKKARGSSSSSRDSGSPSLIRGKQPPPSSPSSASRACPLTSLPPCPFTSPPSSSLQLKSPLLSPACCLPPDARGLTGRSVKRLQRLLSPSAALPSTPISDTLRRLTLDDSADMETAEGAIEQPGEESNQQQQQQQRERLQEILIEGEACEEQESSGLQQADSELQPGMDAAEDDNGQADEQAEPEVAKELQPPCSFVQRLEEDDKNEDDSPVVTTRRARRKRIVDSDEEQEDCQRQSSPPPAAVRPLQDVTARYSNSPVIASAFPATSPAFKQKPPAAFATPAPRPPSSRVLTRSVSRSARRQQRPGGAGRTEEEQLSFFSTPVLDRIRQHREQLFSQRPAPEEEEEKAQAGDAEEAEDANAEYGSDTDWIVDDEDGAEECEREEDECDDGDERRSPLPSPSPRRSPPCRSPATSPTSSASEIRLTRSNRDSFARELFASFNSAAFDSLLPAELELCFSNRLLSTAGFCSMRLRGGERVAAIQLAAKVVDDVRRLRLTLAHEMCHAAAWIVDGVSRPPHGRVFRRWAARCERRLQGVRVTTCHSYDIHYRWRYQCSNADCGRVLGRHTDSLDLQSALCRCGHPLVKLGAFNRDNTPCKVKLSGFALFVKQRYAQVKAERLQHRDVMAELSRLYREEQRDGREAAEEQTMERAEQEQLRDST